MPTVNIYLSSEEYAELVYLALDEKRSVPQLIREMVKVKLKKKAVKEAEKEVVEVEHASEKKGRKKAIE